MVLIQGVQMYGALIQNVKNSMAIIIIEGSCALSDGNDLSFTRNVKAGSLRDKTGLYMHDSVAYAL